MVSLRPLSASNRHAVEALRTCAAEGDGSPIPFHERYGFERTGEVLDGEVLLRLRLLQPRSARMAV
jgi:hypothetical protein